MKKISEELGRIIIPMVTPFKKESEDVDYEKASELSQYLVDNNCCDSIAVAGTTGEFNVLSTEERVKLLEVVYNQVGTQIPLMAGTGAASTREAVFLTKKAQSIGYKYAMIVTPYYCKPSEQGIFSHYKKIAESVDIDIMLYNIPLFTGVNMSVGLIEELAKIKNIRGIKDEAGLNPTQMTEYARVTPDDFTIYNGDDIMILCGLAQGAAGVVSGASHFAGIKIRRMIELFLGGNIQGAKEIHNTLDPLLKDFCQNNRINGIPIMRYAICEAVMDVGKARSPLDMPTEKEKRIMLKHLNEQGFIK